jgi:hypothetical protein
VSEISLDLLARTVLELMRLPKFADSDFRSLTVRAHELLTECVRTIEHFERDNYTYKQAIREITGWKRISKRQFKLFEEFYKDYYLAWLPSNPQKRPLLELYEPNLVKLQQLQKWRDTDSIPIKECVEMKQDFMEWHRKRHSKIQSAKGIRGAELKKRKKSLASRKIKPRTAKNKKRGP